jgi:hypothetical protein
VVRRCTRPASGCLESARGSARSDKLRLWRTEKPGVALLSLGVAFAGSRWSNGGVLPAAKYTETRHGRGDRHCLPTGKPLNGPLGARSERARTLSLLGPLRRLLGRFDHRDAAAYEAAAREAFKAATPTGVPTTTPAVDAADSLGPRDAPSLGPFSQPALRQDPTTTRRSGSLGSQPTAKPRGSGSATGGRPAIGDGAPEPKSLEAATTDLLRTPSSVTPVADDFFDGLIRRVEGKL